VTRRRRAFLLAGLSVVLGALAASDVAGREAALDRRIGPLVPVVVAGAGLAAGEEIAIEDLAVRQVPERFAPRGAVRAPEEIAGQRTAVAVAAGADVTGAALADPAAEPGAPVRTGERVADVVATAPADLLVAGSRVDVLVTREPRPGAPGTTELALQDVEVLAAAPAAGEEAARRVAASLRVTLRQAVFLAGAQSFARELRLLPRASGDRRRAERSLRFTE
jgi:pilus assembly protein CpaB